MTERMSNDCEMEGIVSDMSWTTIVVSVSVTFTVVL